MRPKSMVLIMIALGCGLVASIGISQVMESRTGQRMVESMETQEIYVALTDIPVGSPLTPQMVKLEEWPQDRVPLGAITKLEDLEGKMPRTPLYSGEPLMTAKLSDNLGGTGERIPTGYRVMSVKVSADTGVSGLILPGDRVDVLVFLKRSGEISKTGTRTILRDVRIFAVDGKINRETDPDGSVVNVKTISVLVKPDQVERLMLANQLGRLSLSLRRADDETEAETSGATVVDLNETEKSDAQELPQNPSNPSNDSGSSKGFLSFIDKMRQKAGQPTDTIAEVAMTPPAFIMQIHTPDGVEVVTWDDKNSLPRGAASSVNEWGTGSVSSPLVPAANTPGGGASATTIDSASGQTTPTGLVDGDGSRPDADITSDSAEPDLLDDATQSDD